MHRAKRLLAAVSVSGTTLCLVGAAVVLDLSLDDPAHVLLTALATWGVLSIPIGLLVGHAALSED